MAWPAGRITAKLKEERMMLSAEPGGDGDDAQKSYRVYIVTLTLKGGIFSEKQ